MEKERQTVNTLIRSGSVLFALGLTVQKLTVVSLLYILQKLGAVGCRWNRNSQNQDQTAPGLHCQDLLDYICHFSIYIYIPKESGCRVTNAGVLLHGVQHRNISVVNFFVFLRLFFALLLLYVT